MAGKAAAEETGTLLSVSNNHQQRFDSHGGYLKDPGF